MTKIKLLAKYDRNEQRDYRQGNTLWENLFWERFISQELVIENGKEVPKYEVLVACGHPKIKELEKERISLKKFQTKQNYSYEISFEDDKSLLLNMRRNDRERFFLPDSQVPITIKDNSYEDKLKELKSLNNLIPGEESKWKDFIASFRQELNQLTNEDTEKYQKSKEFIDELEAEFNKKIGKGNDDNRERERERERNWSITETNWGFRGYC